MPLNCSTFVTQKEQLKSQAARGVGSGWDSGRKQSYVTVFDNNGSKYQDLYWNGTTWHSLDNETKVNQVRVTNTLLKPSKS